MQTKISKDVLDNSNVSGYIEEKLPWVQFMEKLPDDITDLLSRTPIGGLIITNEDPKETT